MNQLAVALAPSPDRPEPPARAPSLLDQLAALVDCPRVEDYLCIVARSAHGVRSAQVERPTLGVVLRGRKRLHGAGYDVALAPGDVFMIMRPCRLDAFNGLDANGLYLTLTLPLCDEVLAAARMLWAQPAGQGGPDVVAVPAQPMAAPLTAWHDAMRAGAYAPARAALADLLVRVCAMGHTAMLAPPAPSVSAQVRALVAAQPQRAWHSSDVEAELGVSGATLRRRLAAEGGTLLEAITEARLACAMEMLYTTRWPVKTVAARVGYRSASTFARRFALRYGIEPTRIGNGT